MKKKSWSISRVKGFVNIFYLSWWHDWRIVDGTDWRRKKKDILRPTLDLLSRLSDGLTCVCTLPPLRVKKSVLRTVKGHQEHLKDIKKVFLKSFFHPDQIRSTSDFRPLWCISMYFMLLPPPPPPQFQNWIQFKTMKDHPARSSLKVVLFFASSFSSQNFSRKSNHCLELS